MLGVLEKQVVDGNKNYSGLHTESDIAEKLAKATQLAFALALYRQSVEINGINYTTQQPIEDFTITYRKL